MATETEYLTTAEVAEMMRLSSATVCRYVREGRLRANRLSPRTLRFERVDVEMFMYGPDDSKVSEV